MDNVLEKQSQIIAEYINNGELSLFLGAGITSVVWDTLFEDKTFNKSYLSNYLKLQMIANSHTDFSDFIRKMKSILNLATLNGKYLSSLINLNIQHIWTTNFDKNIEKILEDNNQNYDSIYKECKLKNLESVNKKVIYKINGDIDDLENAVLTQEQYEKHQERINLFSSFLEKELLVKKILIIGYSFTDNIILKSIAKLNNYFDNATNECFCIIDKKSWKKRQFFYEDLKKRYNITPVLLNSYNEIDEFVEKIKYHCYINNVYISGELNLEKNRNNSNLINGISNFYTQLFTKGLKLYSNHGEFLGYHLGASATKYAYENNKVFNDITEIIPIYLNEDSTKYRKALIGKTSVTIMMYGNDTISKGMMEEFIISYENNNLIIPLKFTGKTPEIIYKFIEDNRILFPELDPYFDDLGKITSLETASHKIPSIILAIQNNKSKIDRHTSIREKVYAYINELM